MASPDTCDVCGNPDLEGGSQDIRDDRVDLLCAGCGPERARANRAAAVATLTASYWNAVDVAMRTSRTDRDRAEARGVATATRSCLRELAGVELPVVPVCGENWLEDYKGGSGGAVTDRWDEWAANL